MTERGKFITVEGQDGAGKTTNIAWIKNALGRAGHDVVETREPGGTQLGEELRQLVLNRHDLHIDPMAELLVIFAARAQHLNEIILPTLKSGKWVLCDRFTDATYAYQGGGRGLADAPVESLERLVQGPLRPDLTLLLDIDPVTGSNRAGSRSTPDRFEAEQIAFKQSVRAAYLSLAAREPQRIKVIDAGVSLEAVQRQLSDTVNRFLRAA